MAHPMDYTFGPAAARYDRELADRMRKRDLFNKKIAYKYRRRPKRRVTSRNKDLMWPYPTCHMFP